MAGWNHWLNGHEFEQAPEEGEGQGSLGCCSLQGHKELDMTEWLNNNNSVMVLGGRPFGKWVSVEGEALINETDALRKELPSAYCH